MGVLPLQFLEGATWQSLGLTGEEEYDIPALDGRFKPGSHLRVKATAPDGKTTDFRVKVRIDTPVELDYYRNGGILQTVLRKLLKSAP
jgi:aconitate hydratase